MKYARYFKAGQKIFLRCLVQTGKLEGCFESLTVFLKDQGSSWFDLLLPYQAREGEEFPFTTGMPFELRSESLGLGVRLTGQFLQRQGPGVIRLSLNGDLQAFQNRLTPRLDLMAGLRYTRGQGTLRSFREQWEKNVQILQRGAAVPGGFPRSRINLSTSGVRFGLKAPVDPASLCLLLLELEPGTKPICTLAEVMWMGEPQEDRQLAGMRFLNILESDRKRIEERIRRGEPKEEAEE